MALLTNQQAVGLVVIGALGVWYSRNRVKQIAAAVNPVDENNIFNQAYVAAGGDSPTANAVEDVMISSIVGFSPLGYLIADENMRNYARGVFGRIRNKELGK